MKKLFNRFTGDIKAIAAVEFALIAPVMIVLFFGTIELCNALVCQEKVTTVASTAADLVAQDTTITDDQLSDVFNAMNAIIYPYPSSAASIIITSVIADSKGKTVVAWSKAQNDTAYSQGSAISVPDGLITSGGSVIFAQIKYAYKSPLANFITSTINMQDSFYARPRKALQVAKS